MQSNEAAKWQAMYQSVLGLVEPKHVAAAERIVEVALKLSQSHCEAFAIVVSELVHVSQVVEDFDE